MSRRQSSVPERRSKRQEAASSSGATPSQDRAFKGMKHNANGEPDGSRSDYVKAVALLTSSFSQNSQQYSEEKHGIRCVQKAVADALENLQTKEIYSALLLGDNAAGKTFLFNQLLFWGFPSEEQYRCNAAYDQSVDFISALEGLKMCKEELKLSPDAAKIEAGSDPAIVKRSFEEASKEMKTADDKKLLNMVQTWKVAPSGDKFEFLLVSRNAGSATTTHLTRIRYGKTIHAIVKFQTQEEIMEDLEAAIAQNAISEDSLTAEDQKVYETRRHKYKLLTGKTHVEEPLSGQPPIDICREAQEAAGKVWLIAGTGQCSQSDRLFVKASLGRLCSDAALSSIIQGCWVFAPCEFLEDGTEWVDAPGTNDANPLRQALLRQAAREADALLVLLPRDLEASKDVCSVLREEEFLRRAVRRDAKPMALVHICGENGSNLCNARTLLKKSVSADLRTALGRSPAKTREYLIDAVAQEIRKAAAATATAPSEAEPHQGETGAGQNGESGNDAAAAVAAAVGQGGIVSCLPLLWTSLTVDSEQAAERLSRSKYDKALRLCDGRGLLRAVLSLPWRRPAGGDAAGAPHAGSADVPTSWPGVYRQKLRAIACALEELVSPPPADTAATDDGESAGARGEGKEGGGEEVGQTLPDEVYAMAKAFTYGLKRAGCLVDGLLLDAAGEKMETGLFQPLRRRLTEDIARGFLAGEVQSWRDPRAAQLIAQQLRTRKAEQWRFIFDERLGGGHHSLRLAHAAFHRVPWQSAQLSRALYALLERVYCAVRADVTEICLGLMLDNVRGRKAAGRVMRSRRRADAAAAAADALPEALASETAVMRAAIAEYLADGAPGGKLLRHEFEASFGRELYVKSPFSPGKLAKAYEVQRRAALLRHVLAPARKCRRLQDYLKVVDEGVPAAQAAAAGRFYEEMEGELLRCAQTLRKRLWQPRGRSPNHVIHIFRNCLNTLILPPRSNAARAADHDTGEQAGRAGAGAAPQDSGADTHGPQQEPTIAPELAAEVKTLVANLRRLAQVPPPPARPGSGLPPDSECRSTAGSGPASSDTGKHKWKPAPCTTESTPPPKRQRSGTGRYSSDPAGTAAPARRRGRSPAAFGVGGGCGGGVRDDECNAAAAADGAAPAAAEKEEDADEVELTWVIERIKLRRCAEVAALRGRVQAVKSEDETESDSESD